MIGTEDKKLEGMTLQELVRPFFKCATIAMKALNAMLPGGAEMTLIVRFPKLDANAPLVVSSDDLNEVEKVLREINHPSNQSDYVVEYMNPEMQGRPN